MFSYKDKTAWLLLILAAIGAVVCYQLGI